MNRSSALGKHGLSEYVDLLVRYTYFALAIRAKFEQVSNTFAAGDTIPDIIIHLSEAWLGFLISRHST
jgi:hypothetical protein